MDIGSRTTKVAVVEDGRLVGFRLTDTGTDPLARARELLDGWGAEAVVATGYGRHLARERLGCAVVTEIRAHALGASHLLPGCRTVIDVGGQDSKAIRVENGRQTAFEMNDRCAAGTGRFLEVMAMALGYAVAEFGSEALEARETVPISSMCTVFSESEVVSLIARGMDKRSIALGLHESIISRLLPLIARVGVEAPVVLSGGVARNPCIRQLLQRRLGAELHVPDEPQSVGALGAALCANSARGHG
ncbi:3-hydroxyacyl-ACP dehydratase [candidate division WOR-3 bacterium]|nr:3-hydroxyacyl-ACP dehydratase [candidate division WOR-3 bacterium]